MKKPRDTRTTAATVFRKPTLADVRPIQALINRNASKQIMLPRSLHDVYEMLRDFIVCESSGQIVGVCAMHVTWEDLGEVRSLAVEDAFQKQGIGRTLVKKCLAEARRLGIRRVFTLTYVPDFFHRLGFAEVDKATLPHKVWADCIKCHHFPDCNEVALLREI